MKRKKIEKPIEMSFDHTRSESLSTKTFLHETLHF